MRNTYADLPPRAELWAEWIADEAASAEHATLLLEAAAQDCPAPDVWSALCDAAARRGDSAALRSTLARASASLAWDPAAGGAAWQRLLTFEETALSQARDADPGSDSEDEDESDAVGAAVDRVRALFHARLALPLPDSEDAMAAFIAFESDMGKARHASDQRAIDRAADAFAAAMRVHAAIAPLEAAVAVARHAILAAEAAGDVDAAGVAQGGLLQAWVQYLDAEEEGTLPPLSSPSPATHRGGGSGGCSDPVRLRALYERAVQDCFWSAGLWARAARWADRALAADPVVALRLYRRGARNCLTAAELWEGIFRCSARAYAAALQRCTQGGDVAVLSAAAHDLEDPIVALVRAGRGRASSGSGAAAGSDRGGSLNSAVLEAVTVALRDAKASFGVAMRLPLGAPDAYASMACLHVAHARWVVTAALGALEAGARTPDASDVCGPQLPPHLLSSEASDMCGPQLPPHMLSSEASSASDMCGPQLPPHLLPAAPGPSKADETPLKPAASSGDTVATRAALADSFEAAASQSIAALFRLLPQWSAGLLRVQSLAARCFDTLGRPEMSDALWDAALLHCGTDALAREVLDEGMVAVCRRTALAPAGARGGGGGSGRSVPTEVVDTTAFAAAAVEAATCAAAGGRVDRASRLIHSCVSRVCNSKLRTAEALSAAEAAVVRLRAALLELEASRGSAGGYAEAEVKCAARLAGLAERSAKIAATAPAPTPAPPKAPGSHKTAKATRAPEPAPAPATAATEVVSRKRRRAEQHEQRLRGGGGGAAPSDAPPAAAAASPMPVNTTSIPLLPPPEGAAVPNGDADVSMLLLPAFVPVAARVDEEVHPVAAAAVAGAAAPPAPADAQGGKGSRDWSTKPKPRRAAPASALTPALSVSATDAAGTAAATPLELPSPADGQAGAPNLAVEGSATHPCDGAPAAVAAASGADPAVAESTALEAAPAAAAAPAPPVIEYQPCAVFVTGLPHVEISLADFLPLFATCGRIADVRLETTPRGYCRGYAWLRFGTPEAMQAALALGASGTPLAFKGQPLKVERKRVEAKASAPPPPAAARWGGRGGLGFRRPSHPSLTPAAAASGPPSGEPAATSGTGADTAPADSGSAVTKPKSALGFVPRAARPSGGRPAAPRLKL